MGLTDSFMCAFFVHFHALALADCNHILTIVTIANGDDILVHVS